MNSRFNQAYLLVGKVLNKPQAFGLPERIPSPLMAVLSKVQSELLQEEEELSEDDLLSLELSQDADKMKKTVGKPAPKERPQALNT